MNDKKLSGFKLGSGDARSDLLNFFRTSIKSGLIDSVLMPMMIPTGESYALMVIKDEELLMKAEPFAPIMPVNAANAVKKLTRKGKGKYKTAVVIRPCEVRAVVELVKLNQIKLDDILLFTYDCVGSIPMLDLIRDPDKAGGEFKAAIDGRNFNSEIMKDVCKLCTDFSKTSSDLHFSLTDKGIFLSANNENGDEFIKASDLSAEEDFSDWNSKLMEFSKVRADNKEKVYAEVKKGADGLVNFNKIFENCIGCHNCGSVCPICYCRQCFFDSTVNEQNSDLKLIRAEQKGAITFPIDKVMFHIGRLTHMSLSCVSCGLCSDACPVDIPVANVFSYVASETQKTFDYKSGSSVGDPLPMRDFKTEELGELGELVKSVDKQEGIDA